MCMHFFTLAVACMSSSLARSAAPIGWFPGDELSYNDRTLWRVTGGI
jgi:hypothetical protein